MSDKTYEHTRLVFVEQSQHLARKLSPRQIQTSINTNLGSGNPLLGRNSCHIHFYTYKYTARNWNNGTLGED